jgi:hypothetical protein
MFFRYRQARWGLPCQLEARRKVHACWPRQVHGVLQWIVNHAKLLLVFEPFLKRLWTATYRLWRDSSSQYVRTNIIFCESRRHVMGSACFGPSAAAVADSQSALDHVLRVNKVYLSYWRDGSYSLKVLRESWSSLDPMHTNLSKANLS